MPNTTLRRRGRHRARGRHCRPTAPRLGIRRRHPLAASVATVTVGLVLAWSMAVPRAAPVTSAPAVVSPPAPALSLRLPRVDGGGARAAVLAAVSAAQVDKPDHEPDHEPDVTVSPTRTTSPTRTAPRRQESAAARTVSRRQGPTVTRTVRVARTSAVSPSPERDEATVVTTPATVTPTPDRADAEEVCK